MRPRIEQEREFRRKIIIDATEQLLNEKTFESITIDDIAARSDFAKASIYQYFKNKEELIIKVFARIMELHCHLIKEKCLSQTDPVQALKNYIRLELEFIHRNPWCPKVAATFPFRDYDEENYLYGLYEQKKKLITTIIRRGQAEGIFTVSEISTFSNMIHAAIAGFSTYFYTRISTDIESPEIEMFTSTIVKGISREVL